MSELSEHLDGLKRAFDGTFAVPVAVDPPSLDYLRITVAGLDFALSLSEISRIEAMRSLSAVRSGQPALLGVSGWHGQALPVFSLAALLGLPAPIAPPGWLAVLAHGEAMGLAFEGIGGCSRVPEGGLLPIEGGSYPAHGVWLDEGRRRIVLDLSGVLAGLGRRAGS